MHTCTGEDMGVCVVVQRRNWPDVFMGRRPMVQMHTDCTSAAGFEERLLWCYFAPFSLLWSTGLWKRSWSNVLRCWATLFCGEEEQLTRKPRIKLPRIWRFNDIAENGTVVAGFIC